MSASEPFVSAQHHFQGLSSSCRSKSESWKTERPWYRGWVSACSDEELTIETLINFKLIKSLALHLLDNVADQVLQKLRSLFSFYYRQLRAGWSLKRGSTFAQQHIKLMKKINKKVFIYKYYTTSKSYWTYISINLARYSLGLKNDWLIQTLKQGNY